MTYEPNPSFEECQCNVAKYHRGEDDEAAARVIHDLLLALDGPGSMEAIAEVLNEIREGSLFHDATGQFLGGEDFETFVHQHRWASQTAAHDLGQQLHGLWEDTRRENLALVKSWSKKGAA